MIAEVSVRVGLSQFMFNIKTNNKKLLKKMLRSRDKQLAWMDQIKRQHPGMVAQWARDLDQERKTIRKKLKHYER